MSQDNSTNAAEPEPQTPDVSPVSQSRRRAGEMRSAAPALCLFCANLLLGVILLSGSLWPALFALPQPQKIHPGALPTATAANAVDPQAPAAPAFQPTAEATAHATTQATISVPANATTPSSAQSPTAAPPTPVTTPPTPATTVISET